MQRVVDPMLLIREQLGTLATAFMFLTRLPVARLASGNSAVLSKSVRYFPLVGAIVGLLMSVALWLAALVVPVSVAVVIALVVGVLSTGAFHEDGVADVADSAGAFGLDRKLDIMRDSRVGTYGSLALVLCVLMRFILLFELAQVSLGITATALVMAHAGARWSSVYLMAKVPYVRPETANAVVAQGVDQSILLQATLCLGGIALLVMPVIPVSLLLILPVAWLVSFVCGKYFSAVFKGVTGDCLGAANVVVELALLFVVLALYNISTV